jgi:hypothetical protein
MGAVLGGVVLIGAPLTVLVFLAVPADMAAPLVALLGTTGLVVGALLAVIAYVAAMGERAMRTHRYRIDAGGAPAKAIEHEVAHADKGAQFGGRTVEGRVYPDGSGYVDVRLPRRATVAQHVAVDMAGARGEGASFWTSPHARGDRANAASRVAHLPDAERTQVYREAERLASPRWWISGSASSVQRALRTAGEYR